LRASADIIIFAFISSAIDADASAIEMPPPTLPPPLPPLAASASAAAAYAAIFSPHFHYAFDAICHY